MYCITNLSDFSSWQRRPLRQHNISVQLHSYQILMFFRTFKELETKLYTSFLF